MQIGNFVGTRSSYLILQDNVFKDFAMRFVAAVGECTGVAIIDVDHILMRRNVAKHDYVEQTDSACAHGCNTWTHHDLADVLFEYNELSDAPDQGNFSAKEPGYHHNHIYRFNKIFDSPMWGFAFSPHDTPPSEYFYVYGNYVYNNGEVGIDNYDGQDLSWYWSNIVSYSGDSGFRAWDRGAGSPDYVTIINNTVVYNGTYGPYHTEIAKGGMAFHSGGGSNFVVTNNLLWNNREAGGGLYHQIYDNKATVYNYNVFYHASGTATWYYGGANQTLASMRSSFGMELNGSVGDSPFTDPNGADNTYGTEDDDYTLYNDTLPAGYNYGTTCFSNAVNLSDGDTWMETNSGYSSLSPCLSEGLDPVNTDWTTTPPTVAVKDRNTYGWTPGAYVYDTGTPTYYITFAVPADWATGINLDATLSWVNTGTPTETETYFDTVDASTLVDSGSVETSYDPGPLLPETEYFWRVDITHAGGTDTGDTYSFTTTIEEPPPEVGVTLRVVRTSPVGAIGKPGDYGFRIEKRPPSL